MNADRESLISHLATWIIGALIGVGQMLSSDEKHSLRKIIGQAIVSGGLGAASGTLLLLIPNAPIMAVLGASAMIASLGTSALEKMLKAYTDRKKWNQIIDLLFYGLFMVVF